MMKIKSGFAAVAAGAVDTLLLSITVPEGHKYQFQVLSTDASDDCRIRVYVHDELMIDWLRDGDAATDKWPLDWECGPGTIIRAYGSNTTGGALDVGLTVGYNDVKA
jgi:hypothetical protein